MNQIAQYRPPFPEPVRLKEPIWKDAQIGESMIFDYNTIPIYCPLHPNQGAHLEFYDRVRQSRYYH